MQVYEDKNDIKLIHHVASASTLVNSVAGIIRDFIMERFPKDYFRHVYMDSEETSVEYHTVKKHNSNVHKIAYPSLSIGTEISLDDPIGGMTKSLELSSTNLFVNKDLRRSYKKLLVDPSYDLAVYFASDYITTNFNFKIAVKKYLQNINLAYYMKSRFQMDFFQYLDNQIIETEIPKTFVRMIAACKGFDPGEENDITELEHYLAEASTQDDYITKKINTSTGRESFFFAHKVNLLTYVADLDAPPSIVRNQMNDDEYIITFRVQVSTWLPSSFIMSINKDLYELSEESAVWLARQSEDDEMGIGYTATKIPKHITLGRKFQISFTNSRGEPGNIAHEVIAKTLTYNINDKESERIFSFEPLLKKDLKDVYDLLTYQLPDEYTTEDGKPIFVVSDVFRIRALSKYKEYNDDYDENFDIDYDNGLTVKISGELNDELMVSLFVDRTALAAVQKLIDEILKNSGHKTIQDYISASMDQDSIEFSNLIYTIGKNTNNGILAYLTINIANDDIIETRKIRIYRLNDESDTSIEKSLRIMTTYGIGYIGLTEDDGTDSQYRVCLGTDSENQPIIMQFELAEESEWKS